METTITGYNRDYCKDPLWDDNYNGSSSNDGPLLVTDSFTAPNL